MTILFGETDAFSYFSSLFINRLSIVYLLFMSTSVKPGTSGGLTNPRLKPVERKPVEKAFLGKLQPVKSRIPAVPPVNYEKGGSDFRCPQNTSALGKQVISGAGGHRSTEPTVKFAAAPRFPSSETVGVGPAAVGQYSSLKRQVLSNRKSTGSMNFGTSSRADAWKTYTVYTAKHN